MLCSVTHPPINPFKNNLPYIFIMNIFHWMNNSYDTFCKSLSANSKKRMPSLVIGRLAKRDAPQYMVSSESITMEKGTKLKFLDFKKL